MQISFSSIHAILKDLNKKKRMGYLAKHGLHSRFIRTAVDPALGLVVVIPAMNEDQILNPLGALLDCNPTGCKVEVIVVLNHSKTASDDVKVLNHMGARILKQWNRNESNDWLTFHTIFLEDVPAKIAGVGYARKVGMDEAVWRFNKIGNDDGVIVCFDADTYCDPDYLVEIELLFLDNPKCPAASIYYEHPVKGEVHEDFIYSAIIDYELHLRYYLNAKRFTGHPHIYETIGSAMAVRNSAYQKEGGMNKRKAGEDFYFLNKFTSDPNFMELNDTRVIPSPRVSDRVPFGTGKAVGEIIGSTESYETYHLQSFLDLKLFFDHVIDFKDANEETLLSLYDNYPEPLKIFLKENKWLIEVKRLQKNTVSYINFSHQFFKWFNAFRIMKYVHECRKHEGYADGPVEVFSRQLLSMMNPKKDFSKVEKLDLLYEFRALDRLGNYG